ncbi:DUF975 family protein [Clostridium taeniosporum]|uniref:DUF975 domain-containing protein n=1 Tax=Clostridium taeniosporum TaxID=394958 RepID=A0A1D7XNA9_9CLOT|nr:DUF975 family protein [Clostridium taeniosporum]AOR24832.1 DUF975 domain-containing protein [Clostridium taeniosporum]
MWSREELKTKAKEVLKKIYWKAFLVSIIIGLVGNNNSNPIISNFNILSDYIDSDANNNIFLDLNFVLITLTTFLIILLIISLIRIFLGYCLKVGGTRYFVQSAQYKDNKKCFRFGFDSDNYIGIVKTMLLTDIFIFLWSLLLIIPGIIKSYAYRMVPYILADNPNIGAKKAIALSNEMTRGHKFDIFVLDLSFIGWYLLGTLALFIGTLFVMPYENATNAELYLVLRKNALENNLCTYEDLLLNQQILDDNNDIW